MLAQRTALPAHSIGEQDSTSGASLTPDTYVCAWLRLSNLHGSPHSHKPYGMARGKSRHVVKGTGAKYIKLVYVLVGGGDVEARGLCSQDVNLSIPDFGI